MIVITLVCSCKNNTSDQQPSIPLSSTDSTEKLDTIFSGADITFLNKLPFSDFARSKNAPIDWSKFSMVTSSHEEALFVIPFQPDKSYYDLYGILLKYSPDSTMFIDLDSYNIEIHKDKNGNHSAIEKGPDTEVSLVNLQEKQKTRLVFLGPGNSVEEGGWIDNSNALLIGYRNADSIKIKTAVIWRYHIPTKTFHVYESPETKVGALLADWRRDRLKRIEGKVQM